MTRIGRIALLAFAALASAAPSCSECAGQCRREYDTCVEYAVEDRKAGKLGDRDYADVRKGCSSKYEECLRHCGE